VTEPSLLDVKDLTRFYPGPNGRPVRAVDGVNFHIRPAETLGLVGESGCGKSTTARIIAGLDEPTGGQISFAGADLAAMPAEVRRNLHRRLQIIFQNPLQALDPRMPIGRQIREPLDINRIGTPEDRSQRVLEMMAAVALPEDLIERYPHQISGGQAQRAVIARALTLSPELIVCDEPVSALDVSVQARVMALLGDLQARLGVSYLFISHDLRVVKMLCHRVAVMYLGQIVEQAETGPLYERPLHPYTKALLAAVPDLDPRAAAPEHPMIAGDPPSPAAPPAGCRFHTRCPYARERCRAEMPELRTVRGDQMVRCHFAEEIEAI
jgi:oligopeptide/dipeptide ABC transporter ATP-binding protein